MSKIAAVVVVYNKNVSESITCDRLLKLNRNEVTLVIVDNSEKETTNDEYCRSRNIDYISMNGNKGLSKAYNRAVEFCKNNETDVIVLFDDDTEITGEYFDKLEEEIISSPDVDVFAPVIFGQDEVIYSPNEFNFLRNHFITDENQIVSQDGFNAIASCLAIRTTGSCGKDKDYITREGIFRYMWMNKGLTEEHKCHILNQYPHIYELHSCIKEFRKIFEEKKVPLLYLFIEKYSNSEIKALQSFANGLRRDIDAVENAVAYDYSNGFVEGTNSRLKMIKRTMYGRGSKRLLEAKLRYPKATAYG